MSVRGLRERPLQFDIGAWAFNCALTRRRLTRDGSRSSERVTTAGTAGRKDLVEDSRFSSSRVAVPSTASQGVTRGWPVSPCLDTQENAAQRWPELMQRCAERSMPPQGSPGHDRGWRDRPLVRQGRPVRGTRSRDASVSSSDETTARRVQMVADRGSRPRRAASPSLGPA